MRIIQGCELRGFLHASKQAKQSLLYISKRLDKAPTTERAWALHQYDCLGRYYGNVGDRVLSKVNDDMKLGGHVASEYDKALVERNNLLVKACENRLGLGITYGWFFRDIISERRKWMEEDLLCSLPLFKSREFYIQGTTSSLSEMLATVALGPAMIEVAEEMLDYGIGLGLKQDHNLIVYAYEQIKRISK